MTNRYTILLQYDADGPGYVVTAPALPGCFTQGANAPEAIERAKGAIAGHIAALVELGEHVPHEDMPALMNVEEVDGLQRAGD